MKLSKQQFADQLAGNKLVITLIGMSNIGKSHWSKKLAEKKFHHIGIDAILEKELEPMLKTFGYKGLSEIAKWLGHPYEPQFKENEQITLDLETKILLKTLENISKPSQNTVVDTPGSIIYSDEKNCQNLKNKSLIVYLQATPEMQSEMFENFLNHPKPIIWGDSFQKSATDSDQEALAKCYPELLKYRSKLYEKYADVTIPHPKIKNLTESEHFLNLIQNYL